MKRVLKSKTILCILTMIILLVILQSFSFAKTKNVQMIEKSENEYMIYASNLLDEKFEFAFSNEEDEDTLEFRDSAMDQEKDGNHIAYIDQDLYEQYFNGKKSVFLWVKQDGEYKLKAEPIKLADVLSEETIQDYNKVTKKIAVEVGEKELPQENVDGVKITRKVGTINIKDDDKASYSYQMLKATEGTDAAKLIKLANKMNELNNKNMFEKLSVYSEFEEIYTKLMPEANDAKWLEVKEYIIDQPEDSKKDEQYLVWIKKDLEDSTTTDVQIMTCKDEYTEEHEKQEVVIKETTKLPVTGDTIALFVIAGIILSLIVTVAILRFKNNNKE